MVNVDAVLVLQRSDVACIEQQRDRFAGVPLLCIDPGILDAVVQAGLPDYQLRRLDVPASISSQAYTQALSLASSIDMALTHERQRLWGHDALHGWDQSLLYLTLQRAFTQRALGQAVEQSFPEARLGLLRPGNPALFHWDAMLYADIVGADAARWSVVARYPHGRTWNPALLELVPDMAALQEQLAAMVTQPGAHALTHIPTCFYDARTFVQAIEGAFAQNVDVASGYCDVPVRRPGAAALRALQPGDLDALSLRYQERARSVLLEALRSLVPNLPALEQQVQALARRCLLQAVTFTGLRRALAHWPQSKPLQLVISDHDVGFHGPLFSVAGERGLPITVLPHSAYPTFVMPHGQRVTVVERDGVAVPVRTVLGAPVACRAVRFRPTVQSVLRDRPKRLCLLLNTLLAEGISYVEIFALIGFHRQLAALCEQHGVALEVRAKPGAPALGVLAGALRLPATELALALQKPLEEAARQADICVAFGEPTSATSAFLDAGSYLIHVSQQDWPLDYLITTPLKGSVMPSFRCEEALGHLQRVLGEPAHYTQLQQTQMAHYASRRQGAHDHIFATAPRPPEPETQTFSATPAVANAGHQAEVLA
jgi:hypothetical protein